MDLNFFYFAFFCQIKFIHAPQPEEGHKKSSSNRQSEELYNIFLNMLRLISNLSVSDTVRVECGTFFPVVKPKLGCQDVNGSIPSVFLDKILFVTELAAKIST